MNTLKWILPALVLIGFNGCIGGCSIFKPNVEPIERTVNTVMTEVVKPTLAKAAEELSQQTAQMQGQGSLINPGYKMVVRSGWGPSFYMETELHTTGVSANIAAATQAAADPNKPNPQ